MKTHQEHYTNIFRFWRSLETFNLPDINLRKKDAEYTELKPGHLLPWENPEFPTPEQGRHWRHTLYFNIVKKETVITLLAKLTGSTEYRDPVSGDTCLSALVVDQSGHPGTRSYAPASFIYGLKLLREKRNPEELSEQLKNAEPTPITWDLLKKELAHLQQLSANALRIETSILCVSEQVSPNAALDAPFLNSYYLQDLDTLIRHPRNIGRPLEQFLMPEIDTKARQNLLDPQTLQTHLDPRQMSPGRWPADPKHGLYSAQFAALNITLSTLKPADPETSPGLIGINGPPGTGKTTLLREVIADVIVTRAKRLLKARPNNLFSKRRIPITEAKPGDQRMAVGYYPIDESIIGHDGIVVASSNNTAIENISKELPTVNSIDLETFPDADYFSVMATSIFGESAWGLLTAVLGRSDNRSAFIDKFWFNKGKNFGKYLREQYDETESAEKNFKETADELTGLLEEFERIQKNSIPVDLTNIDPADIHRLTPYSNEKINTLRSRIFLCSLELHEWAIRSNPRSFHTNLSAFIDMLAGKHREQIDETIAATLWDTFFFCIPVVSVTLASFQRQFAKMPMGSLGWLLLDEAGQATLPSVCGALWRAKKSILIGDTRQIPPVMNIPEALGKLLQQQYKVEDTWSPLKHSAQSLADRVTSIGTYIDEPPTRTAENQAKPGNQPLARTGPVDKAPTWTGLPLRAHRRCDEPMFSIANTIAYNNQMVRVAGNNTPNDPANSAPASAWIDVQGFTRIEDHALLEEIRAVGILLQQLVNTKGKIFIISPFRSISKICNDQFYQRGKIECGTIHTFQGREAEMVILVLGTLPGSKKAREWVSAAPNILNVAITRARHRLYVIGSQTTWSTHRYFDHLAKTLPRKVPDYSFDLPDRSPDAPTTQST